MDGQGCHTYAFIAIRHVCALGMANELYELPIWSLSQTVTPACTYAGRSTASRRIRYLLARIYRSHALSGAKV